MSNVIPASLVEYFSPPADYIGKFGIITGYSANSRFMNDALEKFTQNVKWQRSFEGEASIALMLDPKHDPITPVDCPGLIHLASESKVVNTFKLLHAKVGLLLFKNKLKNEQIVRLIVSTGNWTTETLEDSLDIIWSVDYEIDSAEDVPQIRTDIVTSYKFINSTMKFFNTDLLTSTLANKHLTPTANRYQIFIDTMNKIKVSRDVTPRFFDNREKSLLDQLPSLIFTHADNKKRNRLLLGSGFFGSEILSNGMPKTIEKIENTLGKNGLLTKQTQKDLYVNPINCQEIASCAEILQDNNWTIRKAFDVIYEGKKQSRNLHAKFIFSANYTKNQDDCKNSWLYIGSGNLTSPGFLKKASKNSGNLEAGILFSPINLNWHEQDSENCISYKLPVDWDDERTIEDNNDLKSGNEMPEHEGDFVAAPVSYFTLSKKDKKGYILTPTISSDLAYQVFTPNKTPCELKDNKFRWGFESPRQVKISWQDYEQDFHAYIPVFDEFGRLAATELPELEIDDAWGQLIAFPSLPVDDSSNGDGDAKDDPSKGDLGLPSGKIKNSGYHINNMMSLIEDIAQKQTEIDKNDWTQWCHRLKQTMCQMAKSTIIKYFISININPISPLWEKPFRPIFAENNTSEEGQLYENILEIIEQELKLADLLKLGESNE